MVLLYQDSRRWYQTHGLNRGGGEKLSSEQDKGFLCLCPIKRSSGATIARTSSSCSGEPSQWRDLHSSARVEQLKRKHHYGTVSLGAGDDLYSMDDDWLEGFQAIAHARAAPRQVDDEGVACHAGDSSGQSGERRAREPGGA